MANRNDYRNMLGERFENAYKTKNEFKRPSETEMAKWKHLAKLRRKEKRRQAKIVASLASVFAMVFCFSVVSLFQLPDAEAGEDQIVDLKELNTDDEITKVDVYLDYKEVPNDIKEDFYMFENLPDGYEFSEMEVITVGKKVKINSQFKNENGNSLVIKQKSTEDFTGVIANSDRIETWNGLDVYIKTFMSGDEQTVYIFIVEDTFVSIVAENGVKENTIKEIIERL